MVCADQIAAGRMGSNLGLLGFGSTSLLSDVAESCQGLAASLTHLLTLVKSSKREAMRKRFDAVMPRAIWSIHAVVAYRTCQNYSLKNNYLRPERKN